MYYKLFFFTISSVFLSLFCNLAFQFWRETFDLQAYAHRNFDLRNTQRLSYFERITTEVVRISQKVERSYIQKQIKLYKPFRSFTHLWLRCEQSKRKVDYFSN